MHRLWSIRHLPRTVRDAALAVAVGGADLLIFWAPSPPAPPAAVVPSHLLGYLALVWRRRLPVVVFALMWLHSVGAVALSAGYYRPTLGLAFALYTVAAYRGRLPSLLALASTALPTALVVAQEVRTAPADQDVQWLLISSLLLSITYGCAWVGGRWRHTHRRFVLESQRREEAEASVAVAAERSRIAAELHDIVAHSVTVMVLQAAGARGRLADDPALVDRALGNIESAGQQAMVELRRLLRLVQSGDGTSPAAAYTPRPGIAEIEDLAAVMRSVGLAVEIRTAGTPAELDPGVDLAAYRVVQEALTNAAKHEGPGARAVVTLTWTDTALHISVLDGGGSGASPAALSAGHGLTAMQERVRAAAGRLRVAPVPGGGFLVEATLPVPYRDTRHAVAGGDGA